MRKLLIIVVAICLFVAGSVSSSAGHKPCPGNSCHTTSTIPVTTTTAQTQTCTTDATQQVLSQIAAAPDYSTIQFVANGCYRIEGTIELFNRHGLTFQGNGATFESFDPPSDQRAIWRTWDSSVTFNNMKIIGSYTNGGTLTDSLQHAHGIDLRNSVGQINDVQMSDLAGDCIYFGLGSSGGSQDSSCNSIGRNAVSVVSANNVLVQRMTVDKVGFDAFDVEPNANTNAGSNNVKFDSNTIGANVYLSVFAIVPNEPISNLTISNNTAAIMKVDTATLAYRPQTVTVTGNVSTQPGHMQFDSIDGLIVTGNTNVTITKTNCT